MYVPASRDVVAETNVLTSFERSHIPFVIFIEFRLQLPVIMSVQSRSLHLLLTVYAAVYTPERNYFFSSIVALFVDCRKKLTLTDLLSPTRYGKAYPSGGKKVSAYFGTKSSIVMTS
jgi:hypothetical protein